MNPGECEKKDRFPTPENGDGIAAHSIEAFLNRLSDLCEADDAGIGHDRPGRAKAEAKQAASVAREFGILKQESESWAEFCQANQDLHFGTEHAVELDPASSRMVKLTKPPGFGLTPAVVRHPVVNLRNDPDLPTHRHVIEFAWATPIEYLTRWADANAVFGDSVQLAAVVQWPDESVSFVITQPQYHGYPATTPEIGDYFKRFGWQHIRDPGGQHEIFYHYGYGVMAIDALPRNCYFHRSELLPFDVILCRPTPEMEAFLKLYPDSVMP